MTDNQIIDGIEKREGWPKYTNRPDDLGGTTKGGITLDTFRAWRHDPTLHPKDLELLDEPEARAIYQFMFLQPFAALGDERLRLFLIDLGVLRGPRKAAIVLQQVVGARPFDGWIGPETVKALKPFKCRDLLLMLIGSRFSHIEARVLEDKTQEWARTGWRNRNLGFIPE
jgi:lysozyme family protein